jgi:hypothetical protein
MEFLFQIHGDPLVQNLPVAGVAPNDDVRHLVLDNRPPALDRDAG